MQKNRLSTLPAEPKISVVTVSYNSGEFIKRNIESVLAQGYPNVEHIIIDGGSTDNTKEILTSYPHLNWVSESDRGQSHGLNKGFAKASGDIIAWLNSDDYYPEGVFEKIVASLRDYPIVMGACQVVDKEGNNTEHVPNIERGWHDLLRYWVNYSSPSQPSIFFRKEVLDSVVRGEDQYVDESLYYSMDLDLWLRVAKEYPLIKRLPDTLSIFPIYDECKTGGDWEPVYKEMSRVFRRHESSFFPTETGLSCIIPLKKNTTVYELDQTLRSFADQLDKDFEVLLLMRERPDAYEAIKETINVYRQSLYPLQVRTLSRTEGLSLQEIFLRSTSAPYLFVCPAGTKLDPSFSMVTKQSFHYDQLGAILFEKGTQQEERRRITVENILEAKLEENVFAVRRIALQELTLKQFEELTVHTQRELCVKFHWKAWQVHSIRSLRERVSLPQETTIVEIADEDIQIIASALRECLEIEKDDPFYPARLASQMSFEIPDQMRQQLLHFSS